ncbi:hypothetical protein lerEdw1_012909 [Lerista edwardsae]|nr:hypothetical protein lerEdw1_012909 [Lerista edwardsae]
MFTSDNDDDVLWHISLLVTIWSKSQNCLWSTIIGGLTGNLKEKPKPTIVYDQRPPEEILADELPPVESSEALVKTSFRYLGHLAVLFLQGAEYLGHELRYLGHAAIETG